MKNLLKRSKKKWNRAYIILFIHFIMSSFYGCYFPQGVGSSGSGSITGTVMRSSALGGSGSTALEWALVEVSQNGKVVANGVTDEGGKYEISEIPEGNYQLSVSSDCHRKKNVGEIGVLKGYTLKEDATLTPVLSSANQSPEILSDDPKRPVALISNDLGIQPEQFRSCFKNVNPAGQGTRPTSDRVHSNKSVLLSCLQRANSQITNDKLDEVMDRYRPGGREGQMPLQ